MRASNYERPVLHDTGSHVFRFPRGSRGAMWVSLEDVVMLISLDDTEQKKCLPKGSEFWQLAPWTKDNDGTVCMRILVEDHRCFVEGWLKLQVPAVQGNLGK